MAADEKLVPTVTITTRPRTSSEDSFAPSFRSPRTAKFAEATAVNSPIDPPKPGRRLFIHTPTNHFLAQPQPADTNFGYTSDKHTSVEMEDTEADQQPTVSLGTPLMSSPLKSAMKTPGAAPRGFGNMLAPAFREPVLHEEEDALEKQEGLTDIDQAKDLKVKTRVRMAKMLLRGVNFSCSLIVLSMLSATFSIFNATKTIPARNNLPPWAQNQKVWPQITLLVISIISLVMSIVIIFGYWRGGHKRAERVAVYYTTFAVAFFIFSTVMWAIGAGILNVSKNNSNGQDMWGWSCKDNKRSTLFENEVHYSLVCRLQNWSLVCCLIEIVVEAITITVYGIVFYRYYSKRRLRKSMATRDRARSDLYLAQLRSQSAPNTPGHIGPFSPRDGGWKPPANYYETAPSIEDGMEGETAQYVEAPEQIAHPNSFVLQPPPSSHHGTTPQIQQTGFTPVRTGSPSASPQRAQGSRTPTPPQRVYAPMEEVPLQEQQQEHFAAAPGEHVYEAVPIPGAYAGSSSPLMAPRSLSFPRQM